jgi:Spy/CpxP family protein refolding chaperone
MPVCSLAIAAGVLGVVAVVRRFVFRRRFARFGGFGPPWAMAACGPGFGHGPGPWGGEAGPPWRRHGFGGSGPGGSFWLRGLFSRLDTTPGQEREIRSAIEEFQATASGLKSGLRGSRDDIARAVGGEVFDDAALGEAGARADVTAGQLKDAFASALRRVHAVLDPKQRERLAELLAKGPFGGRRGGWGSPYRDVL